MGYFSASVGAGASPFDNPRRDTPLRDEKVAALAEVLAATGEPVIWNGQTYQALVSENPLSHWRQQG